MKEKSKKDNTETDEKEEKTKVEKDEKVEKKEETDKTEEIKENEKSKKKKASKKEKNKKGINKKLIIIIIVAVIILIGLGVATKFLILPKVFYDTGKKSMQNKQYEKAIKYYTKCIDYKDSEKEIQKAYFEYGKDLLGKGKYKEAISYFKKYDGDEGKKYEEYTNAIIKIEEKNFDDAIKVFTEYKDFEDSNNFLIKANYGKAEKLFNEKQYPQAKAIYEGIKDYENSQERINCCNLIAAEEKYKAGELNTAKQMFHSLPKDLEFEGITVADRMEKLNKYTQFVNLCGVWHGTNGYMSIRQYHNSTGLWDEWTANYVDDLEIRCIINDNGTVTIKGNAKYYVYTNYSSLSKYLKMSNSTLSINTTGTTIPYNLASGSNANLVFTGSRFDLAYNYTNSNYSMHFDYIFTSSISYTKKTKSY